ncbi:MAG: hypothetical protein ACJ74H_14645 [Thermoanaerobaculia bacterium]
MPSEREVIERVETHTIERKLPHRYDDDPPRVTPVLPQPKIAQQPRLAAEPAREPDIQISIGRIEVRASTPPAPQHRGRGRAVMTIDDYVAKRDGKERR